MKFAEKSLVLLAALGAMLLLAPSALPYNQQQVNGEGSGGPGLRWASMPVTVVINSNGSDDLTLAQTQGAIRAAWATLSGFSTARVSFNEDTNAQDQARTDYNNGINLYYFDETGATGLFGNSRSGAVAITPNTFNLDGTMIDASVIYNGRDYTFSTTGGNGTIDVQSVTTHETEHLLGFDHTGDYTATLFPVTMDNITRSPSPDDVAGISTVYPAADYNSTYGSISGSIRRAAGTAVQAAQVVATNLNGVVIETGYTDQSGNFTLRGLVAGGYTVYAEPLDGPMYDYNVSFTQVDTDFSTTYYGSNSSPQVFNVTAGQTTAAGTLTVRAAVTINITGATPVTARQGQSVSVYVSGTSLDTANSGSIPGSGVTITNITVLSSQQVQFDLSIAANAPLGARSIFLSLSTGDMEPITGGLYVETSSGGTLSYPSGGGVQPPQITTSSLPNGQVGVSYNQTLQASGGTAPYTWSVSAGSLPAGLSLNAGTGVISGTPSTAGTYNFTAQVTDANNVSSTRALSITITAANLAITTASLPGGQVNVAYNQTLQASGGTTPYSWLIASGSLPPGLNLSSSTGTISGTPSTAGTYSFTARVTDASSNTASRALSITINPAGLSVTTSSLPNGQVGVAYSQALQANGGTTPYSWSITSGGLPPGLSLASSGTISGTPTTAGTYNFTAQVRDANSQTASRALSITISPAGLTITTSSLPNGQVNVAYSQTLQASGGTTPYSWSVASGSLPTGLSLAAASGTISGTPTTAGTFNFTAQVADAGSQTATRALSIIISPGQISSPGSEIALGLGSSGGGWVQLRADAAGSYASLGWLQGGWSAYNSASGETRIAMGDVDGDGKDDFVVGFASPAAGWVEVVSDAAGNYALLKWLRVPDSAYNSANGETFPACGDVDGDGRAEILVGQGTDTSDGGNVWVFGDAASNYQYQGRIVFPWAAYNSLNGATYPACADLNGDGKAEVVIGQGATGPNMAGGWLAVLGNASNGYSLQKWVHIPSSAYDSANGLARPACGDVDGDGRADIVIGQGTYGAAGGNLWIFGDSAQSYAYLRTLTVPWSGYNSANGLTHPAVGDVDGDGRADVLVGLGSGSSGWFYLWSDAGANYAGIGWMQVGWSSYNSANGVTWPAMGRFQ